MLAGWSSVATVIIRSLWSPGMAGQIIVVANARTLGLAHREAQLIKVSFGSSRSGQRVLESWLMKIADGQLEEAGWEKGHCRSTVRF